MTKRFLGVICLTLLISCSYSTMQAQVLVHQEPKHHLVFENKQIRILNVVMAPGDSSIFHIHHTPSLFLFFTNTQTGSMLQGKSASMRKTTAGDMLYENLAAPNTRIHRVWNADKDTFQVMDIELLSKDSDFVQAPLALPGLKKEIDTAWARIYRLTLSKGQHFKLNEKGRSFVLVSFSSAVVNVDLNGKAESKTMVRGGFIEIKKVESFAILNSGNKTSEFALLELTDK